MSTFLCATISSVSMLVSRGSTYACRPVTSFSPLSSSSGLLEDMVEPPSKRHKQAHFGLSYPDISQEDKMKILAPPMIDFLRREECVISCLLFVCVGISSSCR